MIITIMRPPHLKHHPPETVYIPNATHLKVVAFLQEALANMQDDTLPLQAKRYRFHYWRANDGYNPAPEGYLRTSYTGMIEYVTQAHAWNSYSIPWELVYKVEYSNKRAGGVIVDINSEEIRERNLEA